MSNKGLNNTAIGYYRNGGNAVQRNTWFLLIPLVLTFVSQLFIAMGQMRSFFQQESLGLESNPAAVTLRFDLPVQILKGINGALQSIGITWHGINLWYFSLALILLYYVFFMADARKFRSRFFGILGRKDPIMVTHWIGLLLFAAGGTAIILNLLKFTFMQNLSARLSFLGIPVAPLVTFFGFLPFTAFFYAFALKLIRKILLPGSARLNWQIPRRSFFGLAAFHAIIYLLSRLGSVLWKYLEKSGSSRSGNSIFQRILFYDIYSLGLALIVLAFVFVPAIMVLQEERLCKSLKRGAVFFFKNLGPVLRLLAPALLVFIILILSSSYTYHTLLFSAPSLPHRLLFYLSEVIVPCMQVIVQIAVALALASLWFSRNPNLA